MLDIEFLLNPSLPAGPVIYEYSTGFHRRRMLRAFRAAAEKEDRLFGKSTVGDLFMDSCGGLLPELKICDWVDADARLKDKRVLNSLEAFASQSETRVILFVASESELVRSQIWRPISDASVKIEEVSVSAQIVPRLLHSLGQISEVGDAALATSEAAIKYFREFVRRAKPDLATFTFEFERLMLKSRSGNADEQLLSILTEERRQAQARLRPFRSFLRDPSLTNMAELMHSLGRISMNNRWTGVALLRHFYRLIEDLSSGQTKEAPPLRELILVLSRAIVAERTMFLEGEGGEPRRSPSNALAALDGLLRDYQEALPSLTGRCAAEDLALAIARLESTWGNGLLYRRSAAAQALLNVCVRLEGEPAWLVSVKSSLHDLAARQPSVNVVEPPDSFEAKTGLVGWTGPNRFEEIVGHEKAVDTLRERVFHGSSGSLILHGPKGVGKRTLARVFARALMCEAPSSTGSACMHCHTCRNFPVLMDFAAIAGQRLSNRDAVREFVKTLRSAPFLERKVVLIEDAENVPPKSFDIFLKPMERYVQTTTFIFTSDNLAAVRGTIQSRSEPLQLYPLNSSEVGDLCRRMSEQFHLRLTAETIETVVALSRGLPGEVRRLLGVLKDRGQAGEPVADAFELHWGEESLEQWNAAFARMGRLGFARSALPVIDERAISVLLHLHLCEVASPSRRDFHPALARLPRKRVDEVLAQFRSLAARSGIDPADAWQMVATLAADSVIPLRTAEGRPSPVGSALPSVTLASSQA